MYCVAASRCGCRLKHALNPSRNWPNRRSSARAGPVVTRAAYRTYGKSTSPWIAPSSRTANQPDKVVLALSPQPCPSPTAKLRERNPGLNPRHLRPRLRQSPAAVRGRPCGVRLGEQPVVVDVNERRRCAGRSRARDAPATGAAARCRCRGSGATRLVRAPDGQRGRGLVRSPVLARLAVRRIRSRRGRSGCGPATASGRRRPSGRRDRPTRARMPRSLRTTTSPPL